MKFTGGNSGVKRRWRYYKTEGGRRPAWEFLDKLSDDDAGSILAAMGEVEDKGTRAARHLKGDLWEVRADGDNAAYRVIFAEEGTKGRILLALEVFSKKTQKTPPRVIKRAEKRLKQWRKEAD